MGKIIRWQKGSSDKKFGASRIRDIKGCHNFWWFQNIIKCNNQQVSLCHKLGCLEVDAEMEFGVQNTY